MKQLLMGVLALALLLGDRGRAAAELLALDFAGGSAGFATSPPQVFGWQFTVNQSIDVRSLGVFDTLGNGLNETHPVGLWRIDGALLASATVSNTSAPVASASPDGRWLFEAIEPVALDPGQYVIGALYRIGFTFPTQADSLLGSATPPVTAAEVTFDGARFGAPASGFAFPVNLSPGVNGSFGPNFQLQSGAGVIPEPASVVLLGIASAGLFGWAWRLRNAARRPAPPTASSPSAG